MLLEARIYVARETDPRGDIDADKSSSSRSTQRRLRYRKMHQDRCRLSKRPTLCPLSCEGTGDQKALSSRVGLPATGSLCASRTMPLCSFPTRRSTRPAMGISDSTDPIGHTSTARDVNPTARRHVPCVCIAMGAASNWSGIPNPSTSDTALGRS